MAAHDDPSLQRGAGRRRSRIDTVGCSRSARPRFVGGLILVTLSLLSCAGNRPTDLGPQAGQLAACPSSPNCVCSDDKPGSHQIDPLAFEGDSAAVWQAARDVVADWPRTTIITEGVDYIHAEVASAFFGFVDDFELQLRPGEGVIAVRSASRVGYSDMGVNRKRVESLRSALSAQGILP